MRVIVLGEVTPNRWQKCLSVGGEFRAVAIQATELVQDIVDRHSLEGEVAQSFGEAVVGALTLASQSKKGERINLSVKGSGPVRQAVVDCDWEGNLRGYAVTREEDLLSKELGPWGKGLISVLRTKETLGEEPYTGTVPLLTGHLAKDLTFYWAQSEQIPSAVGIAVKMDGNKVKVAGGFLVQALPGTSSESAEALEKHLQNISDFTEKMVEDPNPVKTLSSVFDEISFTLLEEASLSHRCDCSMERAKNVLAMVGVEEIRSLMKDEKPFVRCDFCATEYVIGHEMLEQMVRDERAQQNALN